MDCKHLFDWMSLIHAGNGTKPWTNICQLVVMMKHLSDKGLMLMEAFTSQYNFFVMLKKWLPTCTVPAKEKVIIFQLKYCRKFGCTFTEISDLFLANISCFKPPPKMSTDTCWNSAYFDGILAQILHGILSCLLVF